MIFSNFKHYFIFFNVNEHLPVPFVKLAKGGSPPVWATSVSFVYTRLLVRAFLQSSMLNLIYCLKSSLQLAFCFLFVCMVNQTQMYLSSISPLWLFQVIICNIVWTPLFIGVWDFWKIIEGGSRFSCKNGVCSPYKEGGVVCRKGGKHWFSLVFSLVMYGFCSSNALYSANLSFRMFFHLECFQIKSQPGVA